MAIHIRLITRTMWLITANALFTCRVPRVCTRKTDSSHKFCELSIALVYNAGLHRLMEARRALEVL